MNITLYTTHCPKCKVLETKLNLAGKTYTTIDDEEAMRAKGFLEAPMLEVDGKCMTFMEGLNWLNNGN